ncbi:MAG TPA: MFS transporter [Vicinamibacterales bacterium]|nr:MFS transporter [Vicinamibacterales bacterium]
MPPAAPGTHPIAEAPIHPEAGASLEPASPYRWVILLFGILGYAATLFARQNYAGVQKFIAADIHLDKAAIGLLGSVFFYSYAVFQMPWGVASDKWGSRAITGIGVLLVAGTMVGFASGQSTGQLLFWRAASGIAGAAVYVAMTGGVARWFPPYERGLSQTALGGVGGALGEATAFFLLPAMSIYIATGWRQATNMVAVVLAAIGVLCLLFLRSAPPKRPATTRRPFDAALLADPQLWAYTFLYSAFIMAIRIVQPWIAVYAADMYIAHGLSVKFGVLNGGLLAVVAYSLLGRGVGCPLAGKASDIALRAGVSRTMVAMGWLVSAFVLLGILSTGMNTTWSLGLTAFLVGVAINSFTLIPAAVADSYGPQRTASIVSFMNMVAQFAGATGLALSGYAGISLSGQAGNALAEYRGIWLSAMAGLAILSAIGMVLHWRAQRTQPVI